MDLKYSRKVFHSARSLLYLFSTAKTLWENWHWETLWQYKCWIATSDDSAEKRTAIAVILQWLTEVSFITIVDPLYFSEASKKCAEEECYKKNVDKVNKIVSFI